MRATSIKYVLLMLLTILFTHPSALAKGKKTNSPAAWELRYLLAVETGKSYLLKKNGKTKLPAGHIGLDSFVPANIFQTTNTKDQFAVMWIEFNQHGKVISELHAARDLQGEIDSNILFLRAPVNNLQKLEVRTYTQWLEYPYEPANGDKPWTKDAMVLCSYEEIDRLRTELDALHSFTGFGHFPREDEPAPYVLKSDDGLFYCKHWTSQLANPDRPWIDVTSYEKRGPRVRKFQGYGLFGVTKPVVGKHYKTWICFADCPDGKPGPIADIKAWSKKYELPVENRNYGT